MYVLEMFYKSSADNHYQNHIDYSVHVFLHPRMCSRIKQTRFVTTLRGQALSLKLLEAFSPVSPVLTPPQQTVQLLGLDWFTTSSKERCLELLAERKQTTLLFIHETSNVSEQKVHFDEHTLSQVVFGAGGFLVAQLVRICLPPNHWPPICWMAFSASWRGGGTKNVLIDCKEKKTKQNYQRWQKYSSE